MKRILFVDDNATMCFIYQSLLSGEGERWEVTTALSGEEALKLLEQGPFDVVASDMRMDGMDGIELLNAVLQRYPQTSRIMISGVTDQAVVAEALGSTHQFLVKPVDINTLRSVLVRIEGLDAFLKDPRLKALAGQLRKLPSFPLLYLEIMKAIEAPDTPLQTIDNLIVKDPALMTKLLQIANSAALGLQEKISGPLETIQQLGLTTVRSLALSAHVFKSFTPAQKLNFPVDALWRHLMACGESARAIMRAEDADHAYVEAAYTAGILHDLGKLMLADSLPNEFQNALTRAATRPEPFYVIEQEMFGATHAGLAAYLLGLWGLPAMIVEAVAFHHTPEQSTHQQFSPLTAVHVANALEHELEGGPSSLNEEYLAKLGVTNRLDAWREEIKRLKAN
jgi:HD-like signal output (HDOD) protein/ActR/RegA family two-component response regulator